MGLAVLAMVVGTAMIVTAAVLSNVLTYSNQVNGISVTSTWSSGAKSLGAENDFSVAYTAPAGSPSGLIMLNFTKTGILPTDVTLQYWTGTVWNTVTLTPSEPNTITGSTLATVVGPSNGGVDCRLWYNTPGTYTMNIWIAT
jgi:hypothetical protein